MRKTICIVLMLAMLVQLLPIIPLQAHAATEDIGSMNALDALGIDTSAMPEGYDENSTDNPYGRSTITVNPVYELFVTGVTSAFSLENVLYGHNKPLNQTMTDFYNQGSKQTRETSTPLAATASAAGNFVGGESAGRAAQVVTVGAGSLSADGGLYLYFTDPVTGDMSGMKELIATTAIIGNSGNQMDEDFAESPYLMQNYLQITTGDFDNNGIDEVAVYVAEQGKSRLEIFKLETTSSATADFYLTESNWKKAWTYYFNESPYVSNMVSLTAGDFNRDGTDDIAMTWGYYYGTDKHNAGQAVILYGSNKNMLQVKKSIDLSYNTASIVRAAFTYGDIDGDNVNDLILGGQLATDIAGGNVNTRFLAIYNYDGNNDRFFMSAARNFDLFEKKDNNYVHAAMAGSGDKFYSTPAANTNLAAVNMNGLGKAAYVYMDSLLIEYGDQGLVISMALDQNIHFNKNKNSTQKYYVEYGVVAADFTGDAKETLQVMQYYLPAVQYSEVTIPQYLWWWYRYIRVTVTENLPGELNMLGVYGASDAIAVRRTGNINFSTSFCKLNTDNDTVLLKYKNIHYVTYSDPQVLAVLASAPYFADLDNDELSGNYMESETSYASSTGSGSGSSKSHTLNVGAYISFEKEFEVFGVKVGKVEAELAYSHGWTWETAKSSMVEQTITYATLAGADAVAFYSIPIETYVYESLVPIIDNSGNLLRYDVQHMSVNIPHTAAVKVLPLETYEKIAADYAELPQVSGSILTHTVGDPASYPSSKAGFSNALEFSGNWSRVNYGVGSITQEITMTTEVEKSYTTTNTIEKKVGAGPGDFVFGVSAGYEHGSSRVTITTSGSSFKGQLFNMPYEAEPYGYGYSWKVFSYLYSEGGTSFPVVSYLVRDVTAPPKLPTDFEQDTAGTTEDRIKLTWSYSGAAAGFQIYRYYLFPDGSGSYELAFVAASDAVGADINSGTRYYEYTDTGLDTYTEYDYQIQVIGASVPTESILSPVYSARTKTDVGYPSISLTGVTSGRLLVYPDTNSTVGVVINNSSDYTQTPRYQWQKQTDDGWSNINGATSHNYTFKSAGIADEGQYRCRVNAIYQGYYISAYSDTFTLEYSKRTPIIVTDSFTVLDVLSDGSSVPRISASLKSAHPNHYYVPSGNVTFSVIGADYSRSFTVALIPSSVSGEAKATLTLDSPLPDGAYEITTYYSGSRVYKSLLTEQAVTYLSGSSTGYVLTVNSSYTYGDSITPALKSVAKTDGITTTSPVTGDITYKVYEYGYRSEPVYFFGYLLWYRLVPYTFENSNMLVDGAVRAAQTGKFSLAALVDGEEVAHKDFSVARKEITIRILDQNGEAKDPYLTHPTIDILDLTIGSALAFSDQIADLGLRVKAINTAGTEVTISPDTDPGYYTIIGEAGVTAGTKYHNYSITFVPGTYILTGPRYSVARVANPLNSKIVGGLELIIPEGDSNASKTYPNGTTLVFLAKPHTGYSVKNWKVTDANTGTMISTGTNSMTLTHLMRSEHITVEVDFQVAQKTLSYLALENTGTVECISSTTMTSGAVVITGAEFTFKATPAPGYHFVEWQLTEIGKSPAKPEGTPHADGSNTCEITMGTGTTILYAIFARDSYTLTLEGDLQASYLDDTDNNITTPDELVTVYSGARITGDKVVTVSPKAGFSVEQEAVWTKNGLPLTAGISSDNQSYTFVILEDTILSVSTQNNRYGITLQVTGPGDDQNTVSVTVNGVTATNLSSVAGGSAVVFTAVPAYGYVFDKWIVNETENTTAGSSLHIAALGGNLDVKAVFKDNTAYTIAVTHGLRGNLRYSLNGGANTNITSGSHISVFKGDNLIITAQPETNFMVEYWIVDGVIKQTTSKTQTFSNIAANIDVDVVFGAQSYATVTYAAGEGGAIVSATSDGISFDSGNNSIGNGSTLVFTAQPNEGKMIERWEWNGVVVSNDNNTPLVDTIFTVPALSGNSDIQVFFKDITYHTVTIIDEDTNTTIAADYSHATEDGVRDSAVATFAVTPAEGYAITAVTVAITGEDLYIEFDSITRNMDGSWTCVIGAVTNNLTVTAEAAQLYTISIPVIPEGGSITLSADKAIAGANILLTATPASSQYEFSGWTVLIKDSDESVVLSSSTAASASFTMPAADVTVAAAFTDKGGSNGGGGGGGGGGGFGPPPQSPGVRTDVLATTGGLLTFEGTIVEIPANALPGNATIEIKKVNDEETLALVPAGMRVKMGSEIYEITTTGKRDFGSGVITIAIAYTPGKIASNEVPVIHFYDETAKKWTPIITRRIEKDGKWYAVIEVNHLTKFAVFSGRNPVSKIISLTVGKEGAVVNGKNYLLDAKPFIDSSARTLVPLRFISEAIGASVFWDGQKRTITIRDEGVTLVLTLDSKDVRVNGETRVTDSMPVLLPPGRTFVPLRFISETLGATVDYNPQTKEIQIKRVQ